ncbi:MAG: peptidoglycan DD-metalloendopeptidase family protein [Acidobacteria bacterium]|nr:peptidoglycan DD-metalloendopeptidase family protein [Acidobacteriota bacterium]
MGNRGKLILRSSLALALLSTAFWFLASTRHLKTELGSVDPLVPAPRFDPVLATNLGSNPDIPDLDQVEIPVQKTFEPGETLGQVLASYGVEGTSARELGAVLAQRVDLRRLRAGDPYSVFFDRNGQLSAFQVPIRDRGRVRVVLDRGTWREEWQPFVRRTELHVVSGDLETSLEAGIEKAGGPSSLAYVMADALQWDLDFSRDLRIGDHFEAMYEQVYLDGQDRGVGRLLAVRYINRGDVLEAYSFGDDGGFYDGEGRPLRKMFLRSPMRYSRITSSFTNRRFHPVLKIYRPHYGVDYGAPVGTPVRVTSAGSVSFAGWNKGGGKTVKVRHPNDYETAYLHLSRFADGIRPGARVRQGDIIGYVGMTGLATGPHLDYRVQHHGHYINPLSIKSVPAKAISQVDMPAFIAWRDLVRNNLERGVAEPLEIDRSIQLASRSTRPSTDAAGSARTTAR